MHFQVSPYGIMHSGKNKMDKEQFKFFGGILLVISMILFIAPGMPSRFFSPDIGTYLDARHSPLSQEVLFHYRAICWLGAAFSLLASLICYGISKWRYNDHENRRF